MKFLMMVFVWAMAVSAVAQTFTLRSKELGGQATHQQVFKGFGCNGENISPQLYWENYPAGTKSFAVTIFDKDAPTGSGWWHWVVFDIPVSATELKSGAGDVALKLAPPGSIQSITDFKTNGYGGPCPPQGSGAHQYIMTVHALNCEKLGLDASANPALVGFLLQQHLIEKSSLIFYYKR